MKKKMQTKSNWQKMLCSGITGLIFMFAASSFTTAQTRNFKAGDHVEADVNMSSSPDNARWEKATIIEVMMWQGKVSGIYVKTDNGGEYTLGEKHLRPLKEGTKTETKNQADPKVENRDTGNRTAKTQGEFKPGDRVEVDSIMSGDEKGSLWKKATVKAFDPENKRYVVMLDDFNEMSVLIRPGKVWIRALNDGSTTPAYAKCEFHKNYKKVLQTAPPSAELFKAVIFQWFNSINRFYDFGLVFENFKMGTAFKNQARGNGRKNVDAAPIDATIYPLKTKLITCEKDLNSTFRTEWTNEYSCYKSRYGEWVCNNSAPQNHKRSPAIPNEQN